MDAKPIPAPAWIGVVGGGQLGQMFSQAARAMGYRVAVYSNAEDSPAAQVADRVAVGAYDDADSIAEFASGVEALTFEFENISAAAAYAAAERTIVRPQPHILEAVQQRYREKELLRSHGFPTAPYHYVETGAELEAALIDLGHQAVFKTAASGYDGHGQVRIEGSRGLERAWALLAEGPAVVEGFVEFRCELSVIVARNPRGATATYGPLLNDHADHILDVSVVPAGLGVEIEQKAVALASNVADALDAEGMLCVEMFLTTAGELIVNELAPRPHNSGHLTIEAYESSQFDQQVRTLCALELGSTDRKAPAAAMANLLGDLWIDGKPDAAAVRSESTFVHIYGKADARRRRKMGHITALGATAEEARAKAVAARQAFAQGGGSQEPADDRAVGVPSAAR